MPAEKSASTPRLLEFAQLRDCTLLTALALLGPYLAHVIPSWDDTPWGARLLPLFYAPLLGVFWRHQGFTLALALASPWFNHWLFGMPSRGLAMVLSFELVVFTVLVLLLVRCGGRRAWIGPAAYLLTKPFSAALIAATALLPAKPWPFVVQSVTNGWPGIIVLALLGYSATRLPGDSAPA